MDRLHSGWRLGFWCIISPSSLLISTLSHCQSQCWLTGEVSNLFSDCMAGKKKTQLGFSSIHPLLLLTNSFRKPVDPLPICIGLVPDVGIGQIG